MIHTLLQRNFITAFIVLLLVGAALWLPYSINPVMEMQFYDLYPMPLYKPLLSVFGFNPYVGLLLQFACVGFSIFLLSTINSQFRLIEKRTSFYIFLGILFAVIFPQYQQFNPMMFAAVLVLLGFLSIFKLYKNERNLRHIYEAGLLFSTAGLIYVNVYFLTLIVFFGIVILIPFNWRQWISAILGILTPLFFLFSWIILFDKLDYFLFILQQNTVNVAGFSKFPSFSYINIAILVLCSLLFIASVCFVLLGRTVKKVAIHQYYSLLFLFFCFVTLCYIAVPWVGVDIFYFGIVPAVFFIANYMSNMRRIWLPDLISVVLFALVLAAKFV
ncbi:MAG: hypothetical protein FWC39_14030 [Bacteroidetes bacterium]|nr:hypothetical protein [Bacteroidota bacterium]